MDWTTFDTIVAKIRAHTAGERFSLSFSGMGEPLLNPDIFRFIRHVSADAYTGFASNGSALTEANIQKLIEAGLDVIYVSFNGDDPLIYSRMVGGLSFDRVLANLRRSIQLTQGTRLQIKANISVTKANRDHLTPLRRMLESEGVVSTTISMCHSRGGNLRDAAVFDTPAPPEDDGHCQVLKNTLFVDWRGKVFICDHDLHGEYGLGDLVTEPIEVVLERRSALLAQGLSFKICGECHDLLKFGFHPLESGAGGVLSEWVYDIYRTSDSDRLSEATLSLKWLFEIYQKENRLDRLVNRLLTVEKSLQQGLADARAENQRQASRISERETEAATILRLRDERIRELETQAGLTSRHCENLNRALAAIRLENTECHLRLHDYDRQIHGLDRRIRELDDELSKRDRALRELDVRLQRIRRSRLWRVRRIVVKLLGFLGWRDDRKD
jgi:uncharacterized coiled-coil protein SlyX